MWLINYAFSPCKPFALAGCQTLIAPNKQTQQSEDKKTRREEKKKSCCTTIWQTKHLSTNYEYFSSCLLLGAVALCIAIDDVSQDLFQQFFTKSKRIWKNILKPTVFEAMTFLQIHKWPQHGDHFRRIPLSDCFQVIKSIEKQSLQTSAKTIQAKKKRNSYF